MNTTIEIRVDDLNGDATRALIAAHLAGMHDTSPPESVHALEDVELTVESILTLRETAFADERSFFHHFAALSEDEAIQVARSIWQSINGLNLHENILPTRERARLILEKAPDHSVRAVRLRKL